MNILTDKQYQLMEMLLTSDQKKIKKVLAAYLKDKYSDVIETEHYIIAKGKIPIALAAHMDTVFETELIGLNSHHAELLYDREKNIMHCVGYGGFDDKAGIFGILQIIQAGLRPHIILSTDEERGCIGAGELAKLECPFDDLRYIIQLDRRGTQDCVFYDLDTAACKDFVDYVENFGFVEAYGSFTDITEYCPAWGIAGVNLSIGYWAEHTQHEVLYVDPMMATIKKVRAMLTQKNIPVFPYIESYYAYNWKKGLHSFWGPDTLSSSSSSNVTTYSNYYRCTHCGKCNLQEADVFPAVGLDGKTKFFCPDCLIGRVNWCTVCWEAYEIDPDYEKEDPNYVCEFCAAAKEAKKVKV